MKTKNEQLKKFGDLTCINYWGRTPYRTHEFTDLYLNGRKIGYGDYSWINRPWQRFDYEMSMYYALNDALETISWTTYEQNKAAFDELKKLVSEN